MKRIAFLLAGGVAAGILSIASATASGLAGAPAPFDKGGVKIAVVNFIGGGDWLQAFEAGAKRQADALGIDLRISEARQDPDTERQLIEKAINLKGDGVKGGVVYVAGFAPLDRRYEVWKEFGKTHGVTEEAVWGVVNDSVAASVADQTKAVLRAHPDIKVIFTPWDEFARGAKLAIDELGVADRTKIYGIDISTSDIQAIVEPNSPWVATAATNAAVVGEVSVRAVALALAGQDPGYTVLVKPSLVTRAELIDNKIVTIDDLAAKVPAFRTSDAATAPWIPAPK